MVTRPCGTALYLRSRSDRAAVPASRPCRVTIARVGRGVPRQMVAGDAGEATRQDGESGALPPSPGNGNQPGRGSAVPAPAPPRQIPAAPSPPAVRHEAGPMAEAIAPRAI